MVALEILRRRGLTFRQGGLGNQRENMESQLRKDAQTLKLRQDMNLTNKTELLLRAGLIFSGRGFAINKMYLKRN